MSLSAKVLVIGGGPAGSTAARVLAEEGLEVILLERNFSFIKPCGGGVPLGAFDELGIPRATIKKEVKSIRIVSPKGERLDIELRGGSLAIVERGDFDRSLRHEAEKKGARIVEGEFNGFLDGKLSRIEATIGGVRRQIVSDYVIAADGINSKVRRSLGITTPHAFFTVSERVKGVQTDLCEFWFGSSHAPNFYSWVFPAADGVSTGTGCFEPKKVLALFGRFKERRGITPDGLRRIYRVPIWKGELYTKGKVIFAGDSAGQVMPLIYEGIYYAMKAGEFAARAIIEGKVVNYKRMWKAKFHKRFTLMQKLKNYFLKDDISVEKLISLHRRPEVQEASMRLWLRKDSSREGLQSYIRLFGKFLC